MSKSCVAVSCATAVSLCLSVGAAAAEEPEEVLVTSTRIEESLPLVIGQYGSRVEVLTGEQVARTGSYDVAGALQQLAPGLYISPKNGSFDYIDASLQGSRTADILWLVDGVRINNRLYATTTPLDTIPASVVERIEVLEGGQGLFYGTQAVAGVVNVVTKAFSDELSGDAGVGTDSEGGTSLNGFVRGGRAGHQFVLYASKDEGDGFQPYRDEDFQPSATDRERSYDVLTVGGKYGYDFSDAARVSVTYQHTDADLDFLQPNLVAKQVNSRDEDLVTAKLDWRLGERAGFYLKAYYHDWDTRYDTYLNSLDTPGEIEVESENAFWGFRDYGANALLQFRPGEKVEYSVGYDLQNYWGRDDVWRIDDKTEQTHALFAQVRSTPEMFRNAKLAAGVRYTDPSEGEAATVWNASGQYDFSDRLFVRGNVGTAFRLPSAEELFLIEPCCRGNPDLEPERSQNVNLSVGGGVPRLQWEVVGFARDIDNLISWDYDPVADVETAMNSENEVRVRGAELILKSALDESLSATLSFTYNRARAAGSDQQIVAIPEQLAKLVVDYQVNRWPLGTTFAVRHVGDVYDTTFLGPQNHGDYTVVDVSARYLLTSEGRHRIDARITNLFDEEYATSLGNAERDADGSNYVYWNLGAPRTFGVSYTYSF